MIRVTTGIQFHQNRGVKSEHGDRDDLEQLFSFWVVLAVNQ